LAYRRRPGLHRSVISSRGPGGRRSVCRGARSSVRPEMVHVTPDRVYQPRTASELAVCAYLTRVMQFLPLRPSAVRGRLRRERQKYQCNNIAITSAVTVISASFWLYFCCIMLKFFSVIDYGPPGR